MAKEATTNLIATAMGVMKPKMGVVKSGMGKIGVGILNVAGVLEITPGAMGGLKAARTTALVAESGTPALVAKKGTHALVAENGTPATMMEIRGGIDAHLAVTPDPGAEPGVGADPAAKPLPLTAAIVMAVGGLGIATMRFRLGCPILAPSPILGPSPFLSDLYLAMGPNI